MLYKYVFYLIYLISSGLTPIMRYCQKKVKMTSEVLMRATTPASSTCKAKTKKRFPRAIRTPTLAIAAPSQAVAGTSSLSNAKASTRLCPNALYK